MKRLITLMLSIWAFGLILIPQPVEAEMTALTDKQMEKRYLLSIWSLCLTAEVEIESNDLFDYEKEIQEKEAFRIENKDRDDAIRESLAIKGPQQVYRRNLEVDGNSIRVGREIHLNSRLVTYTTR
jgi:hypothetical protein